MLNHPIVVKVGGSLFDLPDLSVRLQRWLDRLKGRQILLVPGGGAMVDLIRKLDQIHALGEKASHWLALQAMGLNACFLATLVQNSDVVEHLHECRGVWKRRGIAVLDAYSFCLSDLWNPSVLPLSWAVTSDSVAARVARVAKARQLILLKSVTIPNGLTWSEASRGGLVDAYFAEAIAEGGDMPPAALEVQAINFREWKEEDYPPSPPKP